MTKSQWIDSTCVVTSLRFAAYRSDGCEFDPEMITKLMDAKTTTTADGTVRATWPRNDVPVTVDDVWLKPFMGLGTRAAFMKAEHGAVVLGDAVLFQDEVNAAIDAAFAHDLEVTALHNHFFFDEPKVYFMHIGGAGWQWIDSL